MIPFEKPQSLAMDSGKSIQDYVGKAKNGIINECYRVYKLMRFNKRSKLKKRLPARVKQPLITPDLPNQTWSMDFVSDSLECGRKLRVLNILDDFDRSAIAQEISISMPAERVIRILEKVIWLKGKPEAIRCDNGPEFISNKFQD